nr:unnamed protein product [Digitaria exilis]
MTRKVEFASVEGLEGSEMVCGWGAAEEIDARCRQLAVDSRRPSREGKGRRWEAGEARDGDWSPRLAAEGLEQTGTRRSCGFLLRAPSRAEEEG